MSYNILGFFYSGRLKSTDRSEFNHIPFEKLTHLVWAFLTPHPDGSLSYPRPSIDLKVLPKVVQRALTEDCQTLLAIGGWGNSDAFSSICKTKMTREKFAQSCLLELKQTGAHGIDLDWEFPGLPEFGGEPEDGQNFILLLKELRRVLGARYIITIDVPGIPKWYQHFLIQSIEPLVDFISIMSYDLGSPGIRQVEQGAWHNSPLYSPKAETSKKATKDTLCGESIQTQEPSFHQLAIHFLMQGCPPKKLNMGLGFYGRYYPDCLGLKQKWDPELALTDTSLLYSEIVELQDQEKLALDWCSLAQVPMASFIDPKTSRQNWISYDDERSLNIKANYVHQEELGGVLIWELGCDLIQGQHPLLNVVAKVLKP